MWTEFWDGKSKERKRDSDGIPKNKFLFNFNEMMTPTTEKLVSMSLQDFKTPQDKNNQQDNR